MRTLGRFAVGTLGAFCLVWLSALAYSLLLGQLPVSRSWWAAHTTVLYAAEILTFVPFATVIALLSSSLFPRRPVASAFACTIAAMAALFVPTVVASYRYDGLWSILRSNAEFILTFVVGVPVVVFIIQRRRANSTMGSSRDTSTPQV